MESTNPKGAESPSGETPSQPGRAVRRGFSPLTTLVVVVVLLGSLVGVGYMINPPPPEEKKPDPAQQQQQQKQMAAEMQSKQQANGADQVKQMIERQRKAQEIEKLKHDAMVKANGGREPKLTNAAGTDVSSAFFQDHKMGNDGVKQVDSEIAHQKMLEDAANKAVAGKALPPPPASAGMSPSAMPPMAPPTSGGLPH
ncbi:MAG TPA: hypothetical protein VKU00_09300 [Chthonomonadaceae bacterium]|nr:hypothetical protein [Chthonomonadaceae bacterium]